MTEVDTARLIRRFRQRGRGPVFITLTGEPTEPAVAALLNAGARAPSGASRIVRFDSLRISTVWADLDAASIRKVASLPFVARIESSEDEDTIAGSSSVPVNASASDVHWNLAMVKAPQLWTNFGITGERQLSGGAWISSAIAVLDEGVD